MGEYAVGRVRRLYVPFLAWAAIYYAVRYAVHLAIPSHAPPYTVACLAWEVGAGRCPGVENAAGALLLLVGLALPPTPLLSRLPRWGSLAFGVYVVHVLIVEAAQDAMNLAHTRPSLARDLSIMAFGLLASVVAVRVLMRWRWTRWLVAVG